MFIGFSTTLGKFAILKRFFDEAGFKVSLVKKIRSKEEFPLFFELFRATPV